jgi:hypothetical protein
MFRVVSDVHASSIQLIARHELQLCGVASACTWEADNFCNLRMRIILASLFRTGSPEILPVPMDDTEPGRDGDIVQTHYKILSSVALPGSGIAKR